MTWKPKAALKGQPLSDREFEVLTLLAAGAEATEICADLGIGLHTVKDHITKIIGKLGATNRIHAIRCAYDAGLLTPNPNATRVGWPKRTDWPKPVGARLPAGTVAVPTHVLADLMRVSQETSAGRMDEQLRLQAAHALAQSRPHMPARARAVDRRRLGH